MGGNRSYRGPYNLPEIPRSGSKGANNRGRGSRFGGSDTHVSGDFHSDSRNDGRLDYEGIWRTRQSVSDRREASDRALEHPAIDELRYRPNRSGELVFCPDSISYLAALAYLRANSNPDVRPRESQRYNEAVEEFALGTLTDLMTPYELARQGALNYGFATARKTFSKCMTAVKEARQNELSAAVVTVAPIVPIVGSLDTPELSAAS